MEEMDSCQWLLECLNDRHDDLPDLSINQFESVVKQARICCESEPELFDNAILFKAIDLCCKDDNPEQGKNDLHMYF